MALIKCPKCDYEEETTGLVTVCPKCHADLTAVMAKIGKTGGRSKAADLVKDDSVTTHEFIVRTKGLIKEYKMGDQIVRALRGVDLDIRRGEYLSIMGPSGSGKSTLFNMVGGLDKPSSGTCFIEEVDMAQLDAFELAWLRCRKIGYIFQTFNIIPVMTALENVTLPMIFAGMNSDEMMERGRTLLELVGLGDRLHHKPLELSGGQQQRVAVARALANSPAIILADEPTGNLDLQTGKEIIDLLKELNVESGVTIISATHDLKMIDVSDRIVHIRDGGIERIERREHIDLTIGEMYHEPWPRSEWGHTGSWAQTPRRGIDGPRHPARLPVPRRRCGHKPPATPPSRRGGHASLRGLPQLSRPVHDTHSVRHTAPDASRCRVRTNRAKAVSLF